MQNKLDAHIHKLLTSELSELEFQELVHIFFNGGATPAQVSLCCASIYFLGLNGKYCNFLQTYLADKILIEEFENTLMASEQNLALAILAKHASPIENRNALDSLLVSLPYFISQIQNRKIFSNISKFDSDNNLYVQALDNANITAHVDMKGAFNDELNGDSLFKYINFAKIKKVKKHIASGLQNAYYANIFNLSNQFLLHNQMPILLITDDNDYYHDILKLLKNADHELGKNKHSTIIIKLDKNHFVNEICVKKKSITANCEEELTKLYKLSVKIKLINQNIYDKYCRVFNEMNFNLCKIANFSYSPNLNFKNETELWVDQENGQGTLQLNENMQQNLYNTAFFLSQLMHQIEKQENISKISCGGFDILHCMELN